MTAEEADAQFAALVATYRSDKKPRRSGRSLVGGRPGLALLVVYVIGVALGAHWHDAIGKALVAGLVVALGRWAWLHFSPKHDE